MLAMPRSVLLAAWTSAWLAGDANVDQVVARVRGSDEPHHVTGLGSREQAPLADALHSLQSAGALAMRVVLPRPGDLRGLAGPANLNSDAVDAGEVVIAVGARYALVPHVEPFGPPGDQGHFVSWQWHDANPADPLAGLVEADRELTETLIRAESTLASLDLAAWRPEVAQLLDDLRSNATAAPLPHRFPARAQSLAARSARLLAIVEYALADDGAAVTAADADARRDALRPLEVAARQALAAAAGALAEPSTG
jgi:hypothetical protein